MDYDVLNGALLKRYNLTEDGYHSKFRSSKPDVFESPDQFIVRLNSYIMKWVELSSTEKSFEGLRILFVKEQFINSVSNDLGVHLKENAPATLQDLAVLDRYLIAHGKQLSSGSKSSSHSQPRQDNGRERLILRRVTATTGMTFQRSMLLHLQ